MAIPIKSSVAGVLICAAILSVAACSPRKIPPMTVADFMEDRVKLDGVIIKCNEDPARAHNDIDCVNARVAIERLASQNEAAREAKRAEEFERSREQLRTLQDKQREEQEAKTKVDAYHLPLVPVEPPPPPKDPQSTIVGQTNQ
jgi:hypothetical protein